MVMILVCSYKKLLKWLKGATVFAYYVQDPERYGVVEFDEFRTSNKFSRETKLNQNLIML